MNTTSHWIASSSLAAFPRLDRDIAVDVAVIGGGITGVTAAHLLKRAGCTVALLERGRCAQVDTGHTTAHLTGVTDLRLHELIRTFGLEAARAVWEAGMMAIDGLWDILQAEKIESDFQWVPGFLHGTGDPKDVDELRREAEAALRLGVLAHYRPAVPFFEQPGVQFANQAVFHPLKYVARLLDRIPGNGSAVFEHTEAGEITDDPLVVKTPGGSVRCRHLVIATHNPLMGAAGLIKSTLFQTKLALYSSYALSARIPERLIPAACFWDTATPYHYLRVQPGEGHDHAVYGGEDHKTGQEADTQEPYRRLEERFLKLIPDAHIEHRWSGQVIETNDGLPYIGEMVPGQFIATGFAGNGMTFGVLAARMSVDWVLGRPNPWADLFDPHRKKLRGGTWTYLKENKDFPFYLVRERLATAKDGSVEDLGCNEGKVLNIDGRKVAAYRDDSGKVTLRSAICPHLQCVVRWNGAEHTWDCPCHGSRFKPTGDVISGPAEKPLPPILTRPRRRRRQAGRSRKKAPV